MDESTQPRTQWTTSTMEWVASERTLAGAALRYASVGVPVFPCVPGGKQPLTTRGFRDASSSTEAIRRWWQRSPEANIGLPTGASTGVLVVDVDLHSGASGYGAFQRARSEGLAEGWAWLVRTPSGGLHAYYPATPGFEQRSWQVPSAHVDFRGDGGYVIAPPSRIEVAGRPTAYEVIAVAHHATQTIDAARLRRFLEPPRPAPPRRDLPALGARPDKLAAWVASRPEGARNGGLFWAACRMAESGHGYDDTLTLLGDAAQQAGLPKRETESTIRSAYRIASRLSPTISASRPGPTRPGEVIGL